MKKDEVIKYLINKKLVERLGAHYQSYLENLKEDFQQELWLIILELPEDKIIRLYEDKQLDFYILSIARNQITNSNSKFNRKYRDRMEIIPLDFKEALKDRDNTYKSIEEEINSGIIQLDDYQLEIYNKLKTLTPIEKDVLYVYSQYKTTSGDKWGVSLSYIYKIMKQIRNKLCT